MVNLLTLPREVRDEVLEFVIFARTPAPKTLADLEAREPQPKKFGYYCVEHLDERAYTATSLLLVNKQIHHETKQLLRLRGGITYELDAKHVYESLMIPTWTCVPLPTDIVPLVRVNIQSLGAFRKEASFWGQPLPTSWSGVSARVPSHVKDLYFVILHLLHWEPMVWPESENIDKSGLAIRELEIDYIDPEDAESLAPESYVPDDDMGLWEYRQTLPPKSPAESEEGLVRPEWLAVNISKHLPKLLSEGFYNVLDGQMGYHPQFYSSIGHIVIKANGTMFGEFDVGQILVDMRFRHTPSPIPMENWLDNWILWRDKAFQRRRERGFGTVEPPTDWKKKTRAAHHYRRERKSTNEKVIARVGLKLTRMGLV